MNIFEFLNEQNGWRLLGYGAIFIISVVSVTNMISTIFTAIFSKKNKTNDNKPEEDGKIL